jgi:hypothetical protein
MYYVISEKNLANIKKEIEIFSGVLINFINQRISRKMKTILIHLNLLT